MGELGWTLERWRGATFVEFNYAVDGYWRNHERFALIAAREICYNLIKGNPNIKESAKPSSIEEYWKLSIDQKKKPIEAPTEEEIQKARDEAKQLLKR